jgi:hypothetical protein
MRTDGRKDMTKLTVVYRNFANARKNSAVPNFNNFRATHEVCSLDLHKRQEIEAPRIFRQSVNEGGKAVSPTHRPSLPSRVNPGIYFC